jgi:hypothetical protein
MEKLSTLMLFDTPSLVEVWPTAPYLNDDRATSIKEVLIKYSKNDKHGITSVLSEEQIDLPVEYINSICPVNPHNFGIHSKKFN